MSDKASLKRTESDISISTNMSFSSNIVTKQQHRTNPSAVDKVTEWQKRYFTYSKPPALKLSISGSYSFSAVPWSFWLMPWTYVN